MGSKALTEDAPSSSFKTSSTPSCPQTVLLQELVNIRNSIKKIQDWMPPTSTPTSPSPPASDVPSTLESSLTGKGLSLNFDEMSRSTLLKFFEKIVDVIEKKSQQEQTIGDLLSKYPLIGSIAKGTMTSINMFQSGMEVDQISIERDSEPTTIMNHLCTGLLTNNRIDIGRLLPAYKLANIIHVLQSPTINYDMRSLPAIKKLCRNPRATFHEVSICRAYLEVRQHLTAMNLSYEDNFSLVTVDNKSEYKSKLVTPEHNTLTFLSKCVFPPRSKKKKVAKKSSKKEKEEIDICPFASTAVPENQVNNDKNDSIAVRSMSFLTGASDPSYENVQNVNTNPVPVKNEILHADLPTEPSMVKNFEINLLTQSDIKPSNIKFLNFSDVIDISDSESTEGELEQNENATENNHIKGSIFDEGISEDKMFLSDNKIYKTEQFSPSLFVPLKAVHEDFPLQEQSKSILGVQSKSNNQTEFNVEFDEDDTIKMENIDEKGSETKLIDDPDNIIIIDDDDDDKLFSSRSNLDQIDLDVKNALSKFIEVQGKGLIPAVKQEVKTEVDSFTTSTVNINIIPDTTKPTRKRKLNVNIS